METEPLKYADWFNQWAMYCNAVGGKNIKWWVDSRAIIDDFNAFAHDLATGDPEARAAYAKLLAWKLSR